MLAIQFLRLAPDTAKSHLETLSLAEPRLAPPQRGRHDPTCRTKRSFSFTYLGCAPASRNPPRLPIPHPICTSTILSRILSSSLVTRQTLVFFHLPLRPSVLPSVRPPCARASYSCPDPVAAVDLARLGCLQLGVTRLPSFLTRRRYQLILNTSPVPRPLTPGDHLELFPAFSTASRHRQAYFIRLHDRVARSPSAQLTFTPLLRFVTPPSPEAFFILSCMHTRSGANSMSTPHWRYGHLHDLS